ncbi:helix-turn-helix domain-containing protein [Spirosoma utsteinense]|uniref:AraC-like DNA-binding protein n=1 Tax=Spirosoma utsteinense TaxID=2585773 RepID=A0ABR6WCP0_9BACT|nr:helix-turn-helix domain-containing protein [Spirosoma utsteinense]MBC3788404.1 AraC-like DNA-binding protein [Spirosoma utsteinense]MBC3794332.1 AraC-like DNA-binding protein [Spirosoma utsteinense]
MATSNNNTNCIGLSRYDSSQNGQVNVYRIEDTDRPASFPHVRRDFYKIELMTQAQGVLGYANQRVTVSGSVLIFVSPLIPYSWERIAGHEMGFVCLFRKEFISSQLRAGPMANSPLFSVGPSPIVFPESAVVQRLSNIFGQMMAEMVSGYVNKADLLRNYVQLIIHEGLKAAPAVPAYRVDSVARISAMFVDLLNRQFPIASPRHTLRLRNASEFARMIGVHANHLNKALKAVTHKTTTEHITEKIVEEAKALLGHSDWSVADIGYCLGFEHTTNFNSFFKKHTHLPPGKYRRQAIAIS